MGGGTEQCFPLTREQLIALDNIEEEEQALKRYYQKKTKISIRRRYG
jgi:hypothetical protein